MSSYTPENFPLNELEPVEAPNPWPIRAISLLLVVQTLGIFVGVAQLQAQIDWERALQTETPSPRTVDTALFVTVFAVVAVLLAITALALFFQRRGAWLAAMILQGILLFICLYLYFMTRSYLRNSAWTYIIMGYSALIVLYLNTTDVRTAFLARTRAIEADDLAAFSLSEGLDAASIRGKHDERSTS